MVSLVPLARRLFGRDADVLLDVRFLLLLAATLIVVLGTTVVSPILDSLTGVYGVSPAAIGLLVTAFVAPPVAFIPIGGVLADRYGRRPVLIWGLVLFGLAGSAVALTTDFGVALALRGLQGVGFAFTLPVVITSVRDLYSGDREATGQGLRMAAGGFANVAFPILAGSLVVIAWQLPFLLFGLTLPVAAALYVWFEEPSSARDDRNPGESGIAEDDRNPGENGSSEGVTDATDGPGPTGRSDLLDYVRVLVGIATRAHVAGVFGGRMIMAVTEFAFFTYNSLIVVNVLDGTPAQAALLVSLWAVAYTVVATQAGRITAGWDYALPLLVGNVGLGGGVFLVGIAPSLWVAAVGAVSIGAGVGVAGSLYRSLVSGLAPERFRGGLVGAGEVVARFAGSVTPVAMGLAIALLEPSLGTAASLRAVTAATGLLAGAVGVASIGLYALTAPGASGRPAVGQEG